MKKITLFIFLLLFYYTSNSQCPTNSTENISVASTNDGFVQVLASDVELQPTSEYVTVTGLIIGHNYRFISTHGDPAVNDYITITDASNAVKENSLSPMVVNNIQYSTLRIHVRVDATCTTDSFFHKLTLVDLTEAPSTCQKPTVSTTTTLTYRSDKRMDITWYAPEYSTPEGYEWMFVPQGGGTSFSGSTVAPNTSISTGDVLASDTTYDISIRSTCGVNGVSNYTTFSIKTNVNSPPPNDFCADAIMLIEQTSISDASFASSMPGTLLGGAGTDVVAESCGGSAGNARDDVWFKFVAKTIDIHITVEPFPDFDAVVTLYEGDCNSLSYLACRDANVSSPSSEDLNYSGLTIGNTYYARTYFYGSATPSTPTFGIKIWSTIAAIDNDNDGYVDSVDCDDNDADEFPGQTWYIDTDADGYGDGTSTLACERPTNYYTSSELTQTDGDCDDADPEEYPGQTWYLGVDNDGDGFFGSQVTNDCEDLGGYSLTPPTIDDCDDSDTDEFPGQTWYIDADADGYGDGTSSVVCERPANSYTSSELTQTDGDCDDSNLSINPGATEIWYDGVDQNCDGQSDYDQDGDGYDSESFGGVDCDDTNFDVNPGQTEIEGNGLDDDCNPSTPDDSLGVEEFDLNKVKISPNPFNQSVTIHLPLGYNNDIFSIGLYDLNGREIFQKNITAINNSITIDHLSVLQQGLYFIKITNKEGNKNVVRELIKY